MKFYLTLTRGDDLIIDHFRLLPPADENEGPEDEEYESVGIAFGARELEARLLRHMERYGAVKVEDRRKA